MSDWTIGTGTIFGEGADIIKVSLLNWEKKFPNENKKFLNPLMNEFYSETRIITHVKTGQQFSIYSNRGNVRVRTCNAAIAPHLINDLVSFLES